MHCINQHNLYRRLENAFNVKRALPAGRASLGLMAVLLTWQQAGKKGRVAMPANVCHDVVSAVLGSGCEPIFCDIDSLDGNVAEGEWKRARLNGANIALMVHIYGNMSSISEVRKVFCTEDNLIIDDAAQALGASNEYGYAGSQGDVGLLSFGKSKQIETGGAAILFKDPVFAEAVDITLNLFQVTPSEIRQSITDKFRKRFENAREKLWAGIESPSTAFYGLLSDYSPSLHVEPPFVTAEATIKALDKYQKSITDRKEKMSLWTKELEGSGLVPVGMTNQTAPWRYTCRLPGSNWKTQRYLGGKMRDQGLNVSHWYLPAHWFCNMDSISLPKAEQFSQEVFQFWLDESISINEIKQSAKVVKEIITEGFICNA